MSKKRLPRKVKNKVPAQKRTFKGELVDDDRIEDYELSEEFLRDNPLKTLPNYLTTKRKETEEKGG
jgi:hypothetical protein